MNRFPTNYQAYLAARAYAGCTPCAPGDWWCGAMKLGCDLQNSAAGESNAIQQGAGGIANDVQQRVAKGVATTNAQGQAIGQFGYNLQHGAADAATAVTKGLNQLKDSILGESNAIQQGLGGGLGGLPLPLLIGGGLAAVILVLVLTKR